MRILAFVIALLITFPGLAQKSKKKGEEMLPILMSEGISYSLPRTGIRITVTARQTYTKPGPYAAWAEPLLGIKEVKSAPHTYWEIEEVSITTFSEPDPDQTFRTTTLQNAQLQLTPDGCLAGINGSAFPVEQNTGKTNSLVIKKPDTDILFPVMINTPDLSGRSPVEQRAAEAANRILKTRAARYDITAGMLDEFHPDGKAYEESIRELRRIEKENLELFTGRADSENYSFSVDFMPPPVPVRGEVVFRFDENLGFLPANDFSGAPFMIDIEKIAPAMAKADDPAGNLPPDGEKSGIFYRQPGIANILLTRELSVIATTRAVIAQLGTVKPLPSGLINGGYTIEIHPQTGAIKSINSK